LRTQVNWHAAPPAQDFRLDFAFGSNATHWFLHHVRIRAPAVTAVALRAAATSGHASALEHGHAIAARKGLPFECHYLELPLVVVAANVSAAPAGVRRRCAPTPCRRLRRGWMRLCHMHVQAGPGRSALVTRREQEHFSETWPCRAAALAVGDIGGELVMHDFVMAGWLYSNTTPSYIPRLDVQPCGLRQCAMPPQALGWSAIGALHADVPPHVHMLGGGRCDAWRPQIKIVACACRCGIQSMRQTLSAASIRERNTRDDALARAPEDVHWRRFPQMRPFLFSLERVCGTEAEINAMIRSGAGAARSWARLFHAAWCLALVFAAL
jgi:hypothetical protein